MNVFGGPLSAAAQTDADGRFEIGELRAGKYTFDVMKPGYMSFAASTRTKRPPPLELGEGQTVEKIVLTLTKGGVISGQVLDESGDPLIGAHVQALRYRYNNGQRQLLPVYTPSGGGSSTDDLGAFRLYGLEPGDYYVSAVGRRDFGPAAANAEGPGQTYYPGTPSQSEARRVTVRAARETSGIVFPVVVVRLSRVRGRVQSSSAEPFVGSVNITARDPASANSFGFGGGVRPDGTFEVGSLPPGTYLLTAEPQNGNREDGEVAQTIVTVNGEDINDVLLFATRGGVARGRITTDEGVPPPFVARSFQLFPQPADPTLPNRGGRQGKVKDDWTFEISGLLGRVMLRSFGGPMSGQSTPSANWIMKAVTVDGRDVTDAGIDFGSSEVVDNIDIVYTRKVTKVTGQVEGAAPADQGTWVVFFPADESRWLPQSRYVRVARPDPQGQYQLGLVPFDDYLVVAVRDLEEGQWTDPEFLRLARDLAVRLSIDEGETKVQNVKIVEWRK